MANGKWPTAMPALPMKRGCVVSRGIRSQDVPSEITSEDILEADGGRDVHPPYQTLNRAGDSAMACCGQWSKKRSSPTKILSRFLMSGLE